MDRDTLHDIALRYATEGLGDEETAVLEHWLARASDAECAEFSAIVDTLTALSVAEAERGRAGALPPGAEERFLAALGGVPPEKETAAVRPDADADFDFLSAQEGGWIPLSSPGVRIKPLSDRRDDPVMLMLLEMGANTRLAAHDHRGVEFVYLISGDALMEGREMQRGDFVRGAPGTHHHEITSRGGCLALIVTARENYPRHSLAVLNAIQKTFATAQRVFKPS